MWLFVDRNELIEKVLNWGEIWQCDWRENNFGGIRPCHKSMRICQMCIISCVLYRGSERERPDPQPQFLENHEQVLFYQRNQSFSWLCPGGTSPTGPHLLVSLYFCRSGFRKQHVSRLRGAVSAQEALQGSEVETRELLGGTEKKSVSPRRILCFALHANKGFLPLWPPDFLRPSCYHTCECLIEKKVIRLYIGGGKIAKG